MRLMHYTIPRNNWELQLNLHSCRTLFHYTIPRNNWELQQVREWLLYAVNYTIPRNNWELQRNRSSLCVAVNYTIPRNNWELQRPDKTEQTHERLFSFLCFIVSFYGSSMDLTSKFIPVPLTGNFHDFGMLRKPWRNSSNVPPD